MGGRFAMRAWLGNGIGLLLLMLFCLFVLVPLIWVATAAFKREIDILMGTWAFTPVWLNFEELFLSKASDFTLNLRNSLVVGVLSTAIVLLLASMAAYTLYRLRPPRWLTYGLLGWMLLFQMIPPIVIVSAWFVIFQAFGLLDTYAGLVLGHVTLNLPIALWMMAAFLQDVPREIEEAARVDGCGPGGVFFRVVFPLVVPGLIAAGILVFIFSWDEFAVALNLTARGTQTVPVAISKFAYKMEVRHGTMAAGAMVSTLPALIFLIVAQRFIVRGMVAGALR